MTLAFRQICQAVGDLRESLIVWNVWYVLGIAEMRQRYRRSVLGPFWITLTVGTQAFTMGYLLSYLFQTPVNRQVPYICISLVTWTFITGAISDGAGCFPNHSNSILQVRRPLSMYIMLLLWRNIIIYAHTVIVYFVVAPIFGIFPSSTYFLIPLGLGLLVLNMCWMSLAVGIVASRYRDLPLLITNLFTILVWLTPVYYEWSSLGHLGSLIIGLNPFTHLMEVARGPFLNQVPALSSWITATFVTIFGWMMTLALFARTRSRVPYWL